MTHSEIINESHIASVFHSMQARIKMRPLWSSPWGPHRSFLFDIGDDRRGQYFDLQLNSELLERLVVLDVRPKQRHLLLMLREQVPSVGSKGRTDHRVLCGHDEREWFLAGLPDGQRVTTVAQAMDALKPAIVLESQQRRRVKTKDSNRRRNAGFLRQGEWFFVPEPAFRVEGRIIHRNEPLTRGDGKPHVAEFLVREGGDTVYLRRRDSMILTEPEYRKMLLETTGNTAREWMVATREPVAYVKGKVRHSDHKTTELPTWHRVVANTEQTTGRWSNLTFID